MFVTGFPKVLKLATSFMTAALVASCANYSVVNIPHISDNYRYIALSSYDQDLYRELRDGLVANGVVILNEESTPEELATAVKNISAAQERYRKQVNYKKINYIPSNSEKQQKTTQATQGTTEVSTPPVLNDAYKTASNPLGITNIKQCTGINLNFNCVRNFIPNADMVAYSQSGKNLSLDSYGSTVQKLVTGNIITTLDIPYIGNIALKEVQSDLQLSDSRTPLADIRLSQQITQLMKQSIAAEITKKIIFILADQTLQDLKHQ